MSTLRVFFAHPKTAGGAVEIEASVRALRERFRRKVAEVTVVVTPGLTEWGNSFAACGRSWDRWAEYIGGGMSADGVPRYNLIVVPGRTDQPFRVAKATGLICEEARRVRKDVLLWNEEDDTVVRVADVVRIDGGTYQVSHELVPVGFVSGELPPLARSQGDVAARMPRAVPVDFVPPDDDIPF